MNVEALQRSGLGCALAAEVACRFGEVRLKVTGASMLPAIWPEDVVTVLRRNPAELRVGQIVLYQREGTLVAHRIVTVEGGVLTTRGDTLSDNDPPVMASDVVGQVVSVIRHGRAVSLQQRYTQRLGAALLRRSSFYIRITLGLRCRVRRVTAGDISWAS